MLLRYFGTIDDGCKWGYYNLCLVVLTELLPVGRLQLCITLNNLAAASNKLDSLKWYVAPETVVDLNIQNR